MKKRTNWMSSCFLLFVMLGGAYVYYGCPSLNQMIGAIRKHPQIDVFYDSASDCVWGIRFSSFNHDNEKWKKRLEEDYQFDTGYPLLTCHSRQTMDSDGKKIFVMYFQRPLPPKYLPKTHYTMLELKDQKMPPESSGKIVPIDPAKPEKGFKLAPK